MADAVFQRCIDARCGRTASVDDVAFACSLDGTLRTVNRRVTQMLGLAYADESEK